jgi:DUF4097 and DUF4098 domain-containing protein YvlB
MSWMSRAPLAVLAAAAMAAPAGAQGRVDERAPAPANARVEVHAMGTVRVSGWNRNEVHVTGTTGGGRVLLETSGRSVDVTHRGAPGNLEVRVPAGSSVEVSGGGGEITVGGITGAVEVSVRGGPVTVSGSPSSIEVSSAGGPVTIDAQTGSVEVSSMGGGIRVAGTVRERVEISTVGGDVELTAAVRDAEVSSMGGGVRIANAGGRVEVSAVAGDVYVRGARLRGEISNVEGRVVAVATGPLGGPLSVNSHGGDVELRLPSGVGANVSVTSFRGRLTNEVGAQVRRESGRDRELVVGGGGPSVSISTFSGHVKLLRP